MNRAGFFKTLGVLAVGAVIAPSLLIPKATPGFKWKRPDGVPGRRLWILNPDWVDAKYELAYYPTKLFYTNSDGAVMTRESGMCEARWIRREDRAYHQQMAGMPTVAARYVMDDHGHLHTISKYKTE